jgi:tetratricopeptide (TPR) repeat protein
VKKYMSEEQMKDNSGVAEFIYAPNIQRNRQLLQALRGRLWRKRCDGNFEETIGPINRHRARQLQPGYDPVSNDLLLELHCAAASAFDHVDKPEQVQEFIGPWASRVHYLVQTKLKELDENTGGVADEHRRSVLPDLMNQEHLWGMRSWLVQRMGVQQYRLRNYDQAYLYLNDALRLSQSLSQYWDLHRELEGATPGEPQRLKHLRRISVHASNRYWRGMVQMYRNQFDSAEMDFLAGLEIMAGSLARMDTVRAKPTVTLKANHGDEGLFVVRFARYITARILMGLGLLRFYRGELRDAKSTLLTALIMLSRDSLDEVRKQRCLSLLLSVQRMELDENDPLWQQRGNEIISALQQVAEGLRNRNHVNYLRARRTEALVRLRLADLHMRKTECPGSMAHVKDHLANALQIARDNSRMASRDSKELLQSEHVKLRVFIRQQRLGLDSFGDMPDQDPIELGDYLLKHPAMSGHPLIRTATLVTVGQALLERYKFGVAKNLKDLTRAESLLLQARQLSPHNMQTRLLCSLQMVRIAALRGDTDTAICELQKWEIPSQESTPWIRAIRNEAEAEIKSQGAGRLILEKEHLKGHGVYPTIDRKVREFLHKHVAAEGVPRTQMAKRLGISRQSLYAWEEEFAQVLQLSPEEEDSRHSVKVGTPSHGNEERSE